MKIEQPATAAGLDALLEAIFEDLPQFFDRPDRLAATEWLDAAGYKLTRQSNGRPMAERLAGAGEVIALFATPEAPLPKAKWLAAGSARWFDRLAQALAARGFRPLPPGRARAGMTAMTWASPGNGPVAAVTIMRLDASDNVLLAAAVPRSMAP